MVRYLASPFINPVVLRTEVSSGRLIEDVKHVI